MDFLTTPVSPGLQRLSRIGLICAVIVCVVCDVLIATMASFEKARTEIPGPLIGSGLIFGLLTFGSVYMLARLRRTPSNSKATNMPETK